jgi:hypothetical protein
MKRIFSDGRSEVLLPPQEFLVRLCALIPSPRNHLVRYFGAFGPGARGRAALVGKTTPKPDKKTGPDPPPPADNPTLGAPPPNADRNRRLDWADLFARVYKVDVLVCVQCRGRLHVIAFLTDLRVVRKILDHLGFAKVVAPRARPPPENDFTGIDASPDGPPIDPPAAD